MQTDHFIDITNEVCPMTFVRTKLLLESMQPGETLTIHLSGKEPLENVPRNLRDHGETIISFEPLENGIHQLVVKKS